VNVLAELLCFVVTELQAADTCGSVTVLETHTFSANQFAIKVRAELTTGDIFQVRIYCNNDHVDYSYQVFRDTAPLIRWDNKEHFPDIASHPHHFHTTPGEVRESPLTGDIPRDLPLVLSLLPSFCNQT